MSRLRQGALVGGRVSGSLRSKKRKRSSGFSLVAVLMSVRIDDSTNGVTPFQSKSRQFADCNRHRTAIHTITL